MGYELAGRELEYSAVSREEGGLLWVVVEDPKAPPLPILNAGYLYFDFPANSIGPPIDPVVYPHSTHVGL